MRSSSVRACFIPSCLALIMGLTPLMAHSNAVRNLKETPLVPTGKGFGIKSVNPLKVVQNQLIPQNGIFYHGGPVMGTTNATIPNVYYIWYGNWAGNTATTLLTNLVKGIGNTSYYNINSSYVDGKNLPIQQTVNFPKNGVTDNYSRGKSLNDAAVFNIVSSAIIKRKLPLDSNGIYFVLTSADVNETSGFCTQYCGWHNAGTVQSKNIKYAFVGNAARCPNACSSQSVSPNNNVGADAMASVVAHELEETVTDPNLNAWYDNNGEENADKCAWQFGTTSKAPNGSDYNLTINGFNYLIQQNWLNANGGLCVSSL